MSTQKLVADRLWQSLCPSYSATPAFANSRNVLGRQRGSRSQCLVGRQTQQQQTRHSSQGRREAAVYQNRDRIAFVNPLRNVPDSKSRTKLPVFESFATDLSARDKGGKFESSTGLRRAGQKRELVLETESTPTLYEMARTRAALGRTSDVQRIVSYLVRNRKEEPNLRLYSALVLCNVDEKDGAAWRVASLLEEMAGEGLSLDVGICHDVLKVLSVHIDYLLRADILRYMRQSWFSLTDDGHHDITAALFREGQLEMGLKKLEQMRADRIDIRSWLYDLATYTLSENGDFEDALQLIKNQTDDGISSIPQSVWLNLLDNASAAFSYNATQYCFKNQVSPGYINPPSGVCLNILATAARHGDTALATEVFHILGKRGTLFTMIHYDMLLQAYLNNENPDLRAALSLLTIMASVKLVPTRVSTRPLAAYFLAHPDRCQDALDILAQLHDAGRPIPVEALNVIIEAYVQLDNVNEALAVYKIMHTFESQTPNVARAPLANINTFNTLLRGLRSSDATANTTIQFLVGEMLALGIRPDALTYDRLILVCVQAGNLEHALNYLHEMDSLNFVPRRSTIAAFAVAFATRGDERCWNVLQQAQDQHGRMHLTMLAVEEAWRQSMSQQRSPSAKVGSDNGDAALSTAQ